MQTISLIITVILTIAFSPATSFSQGQWTQDSVHSALKEKNPDYNFKGQFKIESGQVVVAVLAGTGVTDLSPLKHMHVQTLCISCLLFEAIGTRPCNL